MHTETVHFVNRVVFFQCISAVVSLHIIYENYTRIFGLSEKNVKHLL